MSLCLLCSFLFVYVFSLSLHPHHWEGKRRKHVLQELEYLQWKACCIVHPCPCHHFGLATPRHLSCLTTRPHRYPNLHLTAELIAMAEMADLASALNKLEVTKKPEEEKASPPAEQPKQPLQTSQRKKQPEEKKSPPPHEEEPSAQPEREEVTHKLGSSKAAEDPSPPESKQLKDSALSLQTTIFFNSPPPPRVKHHPQRGNLCLNERLRARREPTLTLRSTPCSRKP